MLPHNVTYLFPSNHPLSPVPTGAALSAWKQTLAIANPQTMPIIVPEWWDARRTWQAATDTLPPVIDTLAELRKRMDASRQRQRFGLVAAGRMEAQIARAA
jgi:hypothetical protein